MRTWLSGYLTTLILIPVALLAVIVLADTYRAFNTLKDVSYTLNLGQLVDKTSAITHEMQKERGMSAGYIGSRGSKFADKLRQQRLVLNSKVTDLQELLAVSTLDEETSGALSSLLARLDRLNSIRSQVSSQTISIPELLDYYSDNNRLMIELNTIIAHHVANRRASQQFETLFAIANIKESAGIERAVLNSVFSAGYFNEDLYKRFLSLLVKQQTYAYNAQLLADQSFAKVLQQLESSAEQSMVEAYRAKAENPDLLPEVSAEDWFDAATKRIELLKLKEQSLLSGIITEAEHKYDEVLQQIILMLFLLIITLVLTYVILSTLSIRKRQTTEINNISEKIVNDRNLSESILIIDEGDLGTIASDINTTLRNLSRDLDEFQTTANEVVSASENTSVIVEQSGSNLNSMRQNINQLVDTFNSMNRLIEADITRIDEAEKMTSQVTEGAKKGASAVSAAVNQINDLAEEVNSVGGAVRLLSDRINDILGMVDMIRAVAEQTNLLALNAAIEAARAGEQGRGFAVVADEVRTLASRTQASTDEIAKVVDELMSSSQQAINAITVGNDKASDAVIAVNSINEVLNHVVESIEQLDVLSRDISSSAKNQVKELSSLSAKVLEIDNMANENADGGEEVAGATTQVLNRALDMSAKLSTYKIK